MAQPLKRHETSAQVELSLGSVRRTQRASRALAALNDAANDQPDLADTAVVLLEGAAELMRQRRARAVMPAAERSQWEALGARFGDNRAVQQAHLRQHLASADLKASSLHSDAEVASLLDVDRTRISQRVAKRSLYAVSDEQGRWYPRWQFHGDRTLPHLKAVLAALDPDLHPLSVAHWFLTPDPELVVGGAATSPRDWLITGGRPERIIGLAPGT